jgi:predicted permease
MTEWRREIGSRLESLHLPPAREAAIVEELGQHVDQQYQELIAGGATPDAARTAVLDGLDTPGELGRRIGDIIGMQAPRLPPPGVPARGRWLRALWQDTRHAIASLRRTPGFTLTVVAALALTIGPTTAIVSVGNWLLWRAPAGVTGADRLAVVRFGEFHDDGSFSPRRISDLNLDDLRLGSATIADLAGWQEWTVSFAADGRAPRQVGAAHAASTFFNLLGVHPAVGRGFAPDDDRPPYGAPVALLGDSLARDTFGTAAGAVGQTVILNGRRLSVVGVLPPGFAGARPYSQVDVWIPSWTYYDVRHFGAEAVTKRLGRAASGIFYTFVVRLAPGATFAGLQSELDARVPALAETYPRENEAFATTRARVYPRLGPDELQRDRFSRMVAILLAVGGVLLLLGAANVANLLISRAVRRGHDDAVRVALGASRGRLVQLALVESGLLALAGGTIGIALAWWLKALIVRLWLPVGGGTATPLTVPIDGDVLVATLAVSLACGLSAGLAPAWMIARRRFGRVLGRGGSRVSRGGWRVRTGLAIAQLALSLALVTNAALLVTTLHNLARVNVGFDPNGLSVHFLDLGSQGYAVRDAAAYARRLAAALSSDPAFDAATLANCSPPTRCSGGAILDPNNAARRIPVSEIFVSDAYFNALRIPLINGRTFTHDEAFDLAGGSETPVILGEALARRLFAGGSALGQRIANPSNGFAGSPVFRVVGVAGDVQGPLDADAGLVAYLPFGAGGAFSMLRPIVILRSALPLAEVARRAQAHATAIDPTLPFGQPRSVVVDIARGFTTQTVFAWMLSLLGAFGGLLAALGLFGLLGQLVGERTREFGIRLAIGAAPAHVFGLVIRRALWASALGAAGGLALAAAGSRLIEAQLVGVARFDPRVYLASAAGLTAVVLIASVWPARTATRIEPIETLRAE